ncbi:hypothetical protein HK100_008223 [Physocladia obscura]|uniref:protein-serine/threonine phosphatase n=1 Tax=Physocladia obscura TaxID=109957 RepID=A0AAD5SU23_9FUNG|nr:hypothetical protein HK100_008223 [Physocladia obscura]
MASKPPPLLVAAASAPPSRIGGPNSPTSVSPLPVSQPPQQQQQQHYNYQNPASSNLTAALITQVDESYASKQLSPKKPPIVLQVPPHLKQSSSQQQQRQQQQQLSVPLVSHPAAVRTTTRRPRPSWHRIFFSCCLRSSIDSDGDDTNRLDANSSTTQAPSSVALQKTNTNVVAAGATNILKTAQYGNMGNGQPYLLPLLDFIDLGKKCLVLDLDETLVHSSFKAVPNADFVIPIEIDNQFHNVFVLKRPGVDEFMQKLGSQFEIVVFTASLSKYADPVLDQLDKYGVVKHRLFREACLYHKGNYVKDLNMLGRDVKEIIILDNSPVSYIFHPSNAIPISSWFNDPNDTELLDLIPFLEDLKHVEDVTAVLSQET